MRILHIADLHLGQVIYQYYDRADEHAHFFGQLAAWCDEYRPDALVVSGDVFDIQQPGAAVRAYFNSTFVDLHRRFPQMALVITAGNHDSASRIEADSEVWGMSDVTLIGYGPATDVMQRPQGWQDRYIVELPVGFIVAMPFMSSLRTEVLQSVLDRVAERNSAGLPVVMTAHLAATGGDFTGHGDIGTLKTHDLATLGTGYDYLALGHIHRPQTLGRPLAEESDADSTYAAGVARYAGSALHVSCDEQYPHTVSLVDIDRHGGSVALRRLRIDELRHFYTLPEAGRPAAQSPEEVTALVTDFCRQPNASGYIRLRIDRRAPMPGNYIQSVYQILEANANRVRLNPKTIWENGTDVGQAAAKPVFEVAELQQMIDPLKFVRKTIDHYPDVNIEELEHDFEEIYAEVQKGGQGK